jgi:signal transduction histidine kinase
MNTKLPLLSMLYLIIGFIWLVDTIPAFGQSFNKEISPPMEITNGWFYRCGDSPINKSGLPRWIEEEGSDSLWKPLDPNNLLQKTYSEDIIWYRTKLPDIKWTNPAIFFPSIVLAGEVYLDKDLIYKTGEILPLANNKFSGVKSHFIPLDREYRNKMLAVRIFSGKGEIGIDATHPVMIGNEGDLFIRLIRINIDSIIIGFIFIFIGLFSIFLFLKRIKKPNYLLSNFGLFSLCVGFFYVSFDHTGSMFIEPLYLRYYIGFTSYFLFPVGLYAFLEKLLGGNIVLRRIWQIHLLYAFVALMLDAFNLVLIPEQRFYYSIFFVGTIVIAIYVTVKAAISGNREAKIFISAFAIYGLTGLHDILIGIGILPKWYWLSQWGAVIFILAMAYIVERRFSEAHNQLEHYSRELEIKSRKLDKYSQILEQKVAERTKDLNSKNIELETTLRKMQNMQHQLIMQEKMASLGNLVAGVAHEVNNPIGAVKSSAHVLSHCIHKIYDTLNKSKNLEEVKNDDRFQQALSMLKDNNQVINTASERVSEIVLSLKNFARLDEAEFQKVDIHDGIDATLTLVEHEIKNRIKVIKEYGGIPQIKCYPNQLNQVFMNLFVNAVHAIKDKGIIKIKTYSKNGYVYVEVTDNGKGINKENLAKIFDPGFTTKSRGIGTGLGLSISYNIIKKHNGEIKVRSEVGKGTTFEIVLPIEQEEVIEEIPD